MSVSSLPLEDVARSLLDRYWALAGRKDFRHRGNLLPEMWWQSKDACTTLLCPETGLRPAGPPLPPDIRRQLGEQELPVDPRVITSLVPSLFLLQCGQCDSEFTLLIYAGNAGSNGPSLGILPSVQGGLSTPNTPGGVRYYLDQVARSHALGANSSVTGRNSSSRSEQFFSD